MSVMTIFASKFPLESAASCCEQKHLDLRIECWRLLLDSLLHLQLLGKVLVRLTK